MKNVFLMGPAGSGKTALALGLALKFKDEGFKVAYFKPVGSPPGIDVSDDEDGVLMKQLLDMPQSLSTIVPFSSGSQYLSRYHQVSDCIKKVKDCFAEVSAGMDLTIIGGAPWIHALAALGLDSIALARELNAAAVLISRVDSDLSLDSVILHAEAARSRGVPVAGIVFNHVPRTFVDKCAGLYAKYLEDRHFNVLGVIPWTCEIACPLVGEYHEVLGGEILAGEDNLNLKVEDILVGAMTLETAINYFRRSPNKAVIIGGDRTDMALAALETSTSMLILTGGLYPSIRVLSRAAEKGVPVIMVNTDTYSTIEKVHEVSRRLRPDDETGIRTACDIVNKHVDFDQLLANMR